MLTKQEFMEEAKLDLGEVDFKSMFHVLDNEYYELVEKEVKEGKIITQEVYDSLTDGQRYHFNKHHNHRRDKVQAI